MNKKWLIAGVALMLLACGPRTEKVERRTLTLTGTAEVSIAPDICYITLVAKSSGRSAAQDYRENAALTTAMNGAIKAKGIDAKDLQTANFSITPQYHYVDYSSKPIFDGYRVSNSLNVKVRDLTKVSDVLDTAMACGVTQVNEVRFTVENPKKYTAQAREDAVKAAREKGEKIASLTGVKLGKPITISEDEPGDYSYYYSNLLPQTQTEAKALSATGGASGTALQEGEIKLTHTVRITYEIE